MTILLIAETVNTRGGVMYLFIGGPADGERIAVEDNDYCTVPVRSGDSTFRTAVYHREKLGAGSNIYYVFVCDDGDPQDVIARLIAGYAGKASGGPSRKSWPPKLETRG